MRLSEVTGIVDEIRETDARLSSLGKRCGDCSKWMKSRSCPRESTGKNGRSIGPSMDDYICQSFDLSDWARDYRDKLTSTRAEAVEKLRGIDRNVQGGAR